MSRKFLWLVTITVLIVPPILLWVNPNMYNPVLAAVLSGVLFALSRSIGLEQALDRASRAANDRWLPQSESAMHRLLTVLSNIKRFKHELSETCKTATDDLPELNTNENRAVKQLLSTHCRNGGTRLSDIINHLEDALTDWSRFVEANCQGEDCGRIFRAIKQKKNQLETQFEAECGQFKCVSQRPGVYMLPAENGAAKEGKRCDREEKRRENGTAEGKRDRSN